jgi:hypothetical protein
MSTAGARGGVSTSSAKRFALPLLMLLAVAVLLGAFHGATDYASGFAEDARGCDWFGYLRQARLFREQGPIGGLDTAIRDDRTRYLVTHAKASGLDPDIWDYGVAPYCHHYKPRTDRVVLQYPPGTGFLHALWPDQSRQARLTFVACGIAVLLMSLWPIVRARAAAVPPVAAALGVFCILGLVAFVYDRSIPPTVVMSLALGWLTVALASAAPGRRLMLAATFGLLVGLAACVRLPNILLAAGPLVVLALAFLRRPSEDAAMAMVWLIAMAMIGLAPVFVANAINAGHWLATTYGSIDATAPKLAWDEIAAALWYYFVEQKAAAALVVAAILATGAMLVWRKKLQMPAAGTAAAMAAVSLLVSIVFMVTHEPHGGYYLFPVAVYAVAVVAFSLIGSLNAGAVTAPPLAWPARLSIAAAALIVAAIMLGRLSMPPSPHYGKPDAVAFDPKAIVWAERETGNITHFLDRQAAVFTFLPREVRERFVNSIALDGVIQYFVVDSADMENAIAPFRQHEGFRPVGKTFGHDTFAIMPRMHADGATPGRRSESGR